jgi:hypothetical protein
LQFENDFDRAKLAVLDERRGHSFFPSDEELAAVPKLYSTEAVLVQDKTVCLHYFCANADWWIVEVDHDDGTAFGYACLGDPEMAEWGYVSLPELALLYIETRDVPGGIIPPIVVERDLYFTPGSLAEVSGGRFGA